MLDKREESIIEGVGRGLVSIENLLWTSRVMAMGKEAVGVNGRFSGGKTWSN